MKFKSHLYYEDKDKLNEAIKNLKPLPGSKITFFKNGVAQGEAFVDINAGAYYPAISIFKNATVSINFGPNFKHDVEEEFKCKGVSWNAFDNKRNQMTNFCIFADVRTSGRADL